jgi:transcriptional regulator GlxA family with amidase domain
MNSNMSPDSDGGSGTDRQPDGRADPIQIAIVLYPGFTALDAVGPYEVLRNLPDVDLRFVAHEPGPIVTDAGILVMAATHSFAETPSPDIVLVPGSEAETVTAMADGPLIEWLQRVHQTSRYTVSVCSGTLILAAAGILRGRAATTHWIAQDRLKGFGVEARRNERIVRSGKVITAAGVSAGVDLGLHLATELAGTERAQIIQLIIEYDPQPPHDSGHPSKASPAVFEAARSEMLERIQNRRNLVSVPKVLWREMLQRLRR